MKKTHSLILGGLTKTTKMPCYSLSLPTTYCPTGSRLRDDPNSVCHYCYAHNRGNYSWPNVVNAQENRFAKLSLALQKKRASEEYNSWLFSFEQLMRDQEYFRWHDSGDIQSIEHLQLIIDACNRTPHVKHRLPTKERVLLKTYLFMNSRQSIPNNLFIQTSSFWLDEVSTPIEDFQTATTFRNLNAAYEKGVFVCPATTERKVCGDCRVCWDRSIKHVGYLLH